MRRSALTVPVIIFLGVVVPIAEAQGLPPQIPNHGTAFSGQSWRRPSRTFLSVESREPSHPEKKGYLDRLHEKALEALKEASFPVTKDPQQAALLMTVIEAPYVRYGPYHAQNAPYVYLLVREGSNGTLTYCAFRRLEHLRSASSEILSEWKTSVSGGVIPQTGSLAACAEQAMRELQVPGSASPKP